MSDSHDADAAKDVQQFLNRRTRAWKPIVGVVFVGAIGLGLYAVGAEPKREAADVAHQRAESAARGVRRVQVVDVSQTAEKISLQQPATLEPNRRAQLFGQVAGYLVERRVEIGDRVEDGQILGVISTPVLEKELVQAERQREAAVAELAVGQQRLELARRTSERFETAANMRAASLQDADAAATDARLAAAAVERGAAEVATAEAQIERLHRQLVFRELRAPFAGTVTRRTRDIGDYIEVGGNLSDPPIFTILDTASLRTAISVPQAQAYLIRPGQVARVRVSGFAGPLTGIVSRISGEIDPATRTMQVEVQVDNADGLLIAGSYATVEIDTPRPSDSRPALIPGNALMLLPVQPNGGGGPTVAVAVGSSSEPRLEYRAVKLGRDYGGEIEVLEGVKPGERIAVNLPIPLPEQSRLEFVALAPPAKPAAPAAPPAPANPTAPAITTNAPSSAPAR